MVPDGWCAGHHTLGLDRKLGEEHKVCSPVGSVSLKEISRESHPMTFMCISLVTSTCNRGWEMLVCSWTHYCLEWHQGCVTKEKWKKENWVSKWSLHTRPAEQSSGQVWEMLLYIVFPLVSSVFPFPHATWPCLCVPPLFISAYVCLSHMYV